MEGGDARSLQSHDVGEEEERAAVGRRRRDQGRERRRRVDELDVPVRDRGLRRQVPLRPVPPLARGEAERGVDDKAEVRRRARRSRHRLGRGLDLLRGGYISRKEAVREVQRLEGGQEGGEGTVEIGGGQPRRRVRIRAIQCLINVFFIYCSQPTTHVGWDLITAFGCCV